MIEVRLALPQRSPRPFSVPWIWRQPWRTAASELATAFSVSLCVWMPRCEPGTMLHHLGDDALDLVRQRAAVGVAQHDPAGAGLVRRPRDRERIVAVALVAVEEVLAVEHGFAPARDHGPDALADALEVFLVGDAERDAHVIVPRLGDEADAVRGRVAAGP